MRNGLLPRGVYAQRRKLADGRNVVYYRCRATGIRVMGDPGTEEFAKSLEKARIPIAKPDYQAMHARLRLNDYITRAAKAALYRATALGIAYDLTREHIKSVLAEQGGVCAITGLAFDLTVRRGATRAGPFQPSLDRIDCTRGYICGNVRVVCYAVNVALNEWGEDVFLLIASSAINNWFSGRFSKTANMAKIT